MTPTRLARAFRFAALALLLASVALPVTAQATPADAEQAETSAIDDDASALDGFVMGATLGAVAAGGLAALTSDGGEWAGLGILIAGVLGALAGGVIGMLVALQ